MTSPSTPSDPSPTPRMHWHCEDCDWTFPCWNAKARCIKEPPTLILGGDVNMPIIKPGSTPSENGTNAPTKGPIPASAQPSLTARTVSEAAENCFERIGFLVNPELPDCRAAHELIRVEVQQAINAETAALQASIKTLTADRDAWQGKAVRSGEWLSAIARVVNNQLINSSYAISVIAEVTGEALSTTTDISRYVCIEREKYEALKRQAQGDCGKEPSLGEGVADGV